MWLNYVAHILHAYWFSYFVFAFQELRPKKENERRKVVDSKIKEMVGKGEER